MSTVNKVLARQLVAEKLAEAVTSLTVAAGWALLAGDKPNAAALQHLAGEAERVAVESPRPAPQESDT